MGPNAEVLQALLHAAPDAMIAVDDAGTIVYANDRTIELFGWPRDDLIGQEVEVLVPDRYRGSHPSLRSAYVEEPTVRPMGIGLTLSARRRDGSEFPIEISLSPIETADGRLHAAAIRDVTAVRRTEQKFRSVLESAPDAIVGVGADGRISLVNAQAERIFGWRSADLLGELVEVLIPAGVAERHADLRDAYVREPVTRPMGAGRRLAAKRRDGTVFPTEISLSAIEDERGDVVVLAAVRDITERVEMEAERQRQALAVREEQTQRLESLGQLAGGIAHDFNNLLNVITGYVTIAARQDDLALVRDDLAVIAQAADRAAQLTSQLLAFGRRDTTNPEPLHVPEMLDDFAALVGRTIGDHIELQMSPARQLPIVVADRSRLEQVLLNLALNARDAMPDGGTLSLAADSVTLGNDATSARHDLEPGSYVRIRVSDSGEGMSQDIIDHVFEPFFTTKPAGEGTGLGLAGAYGIVASSGGTIVVDSTPGYGTTMSVLLPAAIGQDVDAMDGTAGARRSLGRVLVVEDEDALRAITARMLTDAGYEVETARHGPGALDVLASADRPIDLILADVSMPKMSGPELVRQIARRYPYVRVLFMSGYAGPRSDLGDARLLSKPFSEAELLDAVAGSLPR